MRSITRRTLGISQNVTLTPCSVELHADSTTKLITRKIHLIAISESSIVDLGQGWLHTRHLRLLSQDQSTYTTILPALIRKYTLPSVNDPISAGLCSRGEKV